MSQENTPNLVGKTVKSRRFQVWLGGLAIVLLACMIIYGVGGIALQMTFHGYCCKQGEGGWYPSWSPDGEYITFAAYRTRSYHKPITRIYLMNKDGLDVIQLTSNFLDDAGFLKNFYESFFLVPRDDMPAWSPDGKQIVFVRGSTDNDLYVMNADGSNTSLILRHDRIPVFTSVILDSDGQPLLTNSYRPACCINPTWSPDGNRIAFYASQKIYVVNIDGSGLSRIAEPIEHLSPELSWSPDGSRIIFVSRTKGVSKNETNIFMVNSDGSGDEKQLTNGLLASDNLAWSPDGSQIAFIAQVDEQQDGIFVMNADGTNIEQIFDSLYFIDQIGNYILRDYLSWSPNGTKFAIIGGLNGQDYGLYLLNTNGTDAVKLVSIQYDVTSPQVRITWSPDGGRIAFSYGHQMYLVDTDGTILFQNPAQ